MGIHGSAGRLAVPTVNNGLHHVLEPNSRALDKYIKLPYIRSYKCLVRYDVTIIYTASPPALS